MVQSLEWFYLHRFWDQKTGQMHKPPGEPVNAKTAVWRKPVTNLHHASREDGHSFSFLCLKARVDHAG